ncbi:hypothetical protein AAC387_Pa03g0889 [Persea americana]
MPMRPINVPLKTARVPFCAAFHRESRRGSGLLFHQENADRACGFEVEDPYHVRKYVVRMKGLVVAVDAYTNRLRL